MNASKDMFEAPVEIDAPVVAVTALEDRAHVLRRATLELPAGPSRLRVRGVAPVLSDKTLCGALDSLAPVDGARPRVSDVRIQRKLVAREQERTPQTAELSAARERLRVQLREDEATLDRVTRQLEGVEKAAARTLSELAGDLAWGAVDRERWVAYLGEFAERERALRERRRELEESQRERSEALRRLDARMQGSATPRDHVAAELIVEVFAARAGRHELRLDYIVPCACWRPHHRAELETSEGDEAALRFVVEGCVWQNTGEDWRDVELTLSTERLSLGTEPPRLVDDVLEATRRSDHIEVQVRQQEVQTTGVGGAQGGRARDMPGIDDGGEALELRAPGRVTVPSDGRPHRAELFAFTTRARFEHVVMAELTAAALLKSVQANRARLPILAGPVDLIRDGGFTGRTKVNFIASGERFELGWGPDGALRVQRSVERSVEQARVLSSWTTTHYTVELRLSNLGAAARRLAVIERVPVSEIEKVKVAVDSAKTSEQQAPDEEGFVRWSVALEGLARGKLTLAYAIKKHDDVSGI